MDAAAFHLPDRRYFLSHSIGLPPLLAEERLAARFDAPWRRGDGEAWTHWLAAIDDFRARLAPLIGARADDICPQTNVSSALTKALFALPERARRKKIVLTEDDFPTIGFVAEQARRFGYEIMFLPGGARLADIDAWTPAFHDDVQVLIATHVFSNSAVKSPLREIARRARERGVFSILDIAQSAGAVPVDLDGWGGDFAIGTSVKYLCGGPGAAFLWVQRESAGRVAPIDVGWFSHAEPFGFDIHDFRYAEGAARFWGGTPSVEPFVRAAAGCEALSGKGVEAICAHNQSLLSRLVDALGAATFLSHTQGEERGSHAIVRTRDVEAASRAVKTAGFTHDIRAGGLRVSFHLYNTEDDSDALIAALSPLL